MTSVLRPSASTDDVDTTSSSEQAEVEAKCSRILQSLPSPLLLWRERHIKYLFHGLTSNLSRKFECLDASRPWLVYWMTHSLRLLDAPIPVVDEEDYSDRIITFLATCAVDGGYGGGPGQAPHLATTYAAVMALANLKRPEALDSIDRRALLDFLRRLAIPSGAFALHEDGEVDIRAVYLAAAVAAILQLPLSPLFDSAPAWLARCQTYEGGFAGAPGCEAHGGYAYCGLAALLLLGHPQLVHLPSLGRWLANRQMSLEGGFSGRAGKLVDGCYSFWQGAEFPLVEAVKEQVGAKTPAAVLFDRSALSAYILGCCQWPGGGLVDKPGKGPDYYHTCYCLSGLSIAQHAGVDEAPFVLGPPENEIAKTHPLLNVRCDVAEFAHDHFAALPFQE